MESALAVLIQKNNNNNKEPRAWFHIWYEKKKENQSVPNTFIHMRSFFFVLVFVWMKIGNCVSAHFACTHTHTPARAVESFTITRYKNMAFIAHNIVIFTMFLLAFFCLMFFFCMWSLTVCLAITICSQCSLAAIDESHLRGGWRPPQNKWTKPMRMNTILANRFSMQRSCNEAADGAHTLL